MVLKLGKAAARPGAVKLRFTDYANLSKMPTPPTDFGHEGLIKQWGVLGNDVAGCCVFSGAAHEIMLWNAEAGKQVNISDATTLTNYAKFTGYDLSKTDPLSGENPTDQGTDVAQWLSHRRQNGFIDDDGAAHKIGAYISLEPGNIDQLRYAAYYFDGVGIGLRFPQQWMDLFHQGGRCWPAMATPKYVGGHYVTTVAFRDSRPIIITWGQSVELTNGGYAMACDEAYAYLSVERMTNGVDLQGLDYDKMVSDFQQLVTIK